MRLPIAATTATLLLAQTTLAQTPPSGGNQAAGAEPEQHTAQVQQAKIERTLQGAGFTEIEIMPTAFLVRAKNADGKRVVMIIDPISLTASVIENSRSASDDATTIVAGNRAMPTPFQHPLDRVPSVTGKVAPAAGPGAAAGSLRR